MKCLNCGVDIKSKGIPYCSEDCFVEHGLGCACECFVNENDEVQFNVVCDRHSKMLRQGQIKFVEVKQ